MKLPWWVLILGCYHHGDTHSLRPPPPPAQGRLLAPTEGRYRIERGGERIGSEQFTITASTSVWRVEGETTFEGTMGHRQGYLLAVDRRTAEPVAFEAWIEVLGSRRTARGWEEKGNFEVRVRGIGGPAEKRSIAYAPGTTISFGTPLFHTLATSLLLPRLTSDNPAIDVRTIALSLPMLSPVVTVQTYKLRGRSEGIARVEAKLSRAYAPTGLWLREDGLPVKVRTVDQQGSIVEMILE